MMRKKIFALLLSFVSVLTLFQTLTLAEEPSVVYTEFVSGNNSHTGNGTIESPYNLFVDALDAVADGGTIYIGENGAFINDENDGQPLKINKNVTIVCAPDLALRPDVVTRKGGIVLGADVTFRNVVLNFPNANHAAIAANGYKLKLDNISYSSNARIIHIAGGSIYDKYGLPLSPASGERSQIIISGQDTKFGNIYAGSINGSFDKSVDIEINGVSGSALGNIYASGAEEGHFNSENFLDPDNEPEAPEADSSLYPVTNTVSVYSDKSGIRYVDGATGGSVNASMYVSSKYTHSCELYNIGMLTVNEGTFAPKTMNDGADIYIKSGAALDMSSIPNCAVNDFCSENGILILEQYGCMTVKGSCAGVTDLKISGIGIAEYNHLYIMTAAGGGEFNFIPYNTQADMTLNKDDDGWRTSVKQEENMPKLTAFGIDTEALITTKSQVNGKTDTNTMIPVTAEFESDNVMCDIYMVPFKYTVSYNGEVISAQSEAVSEDGIFEGNIKKLNMNFTPIQDCIIVSNISDKYGNLGEIAAGIYDITITAPEANGDTERFVRLTVIEDGESGNTGTETDIVVPTGDIEYNDYISVSANVKADGQAVAEGSVSLYINGVPYSAVLKPDTDGAAVWEDIQVNFENGFKIGSNQFTVRYNGSENYDVSQDSAYATVAAEQTIDKMLTVSGVKTGRINVIFKNMRETDIDGAVMIAAAYDADGILKRIVKAEQSVNAARGESQDFNFDMTDIQYSQIKVFVWDGLTAVCEMFETRNLTE